MKTNLLDIQISPVLDSMDIFLEIPYDDLVKWEVKLTSPNKAIFFQSKNELSKDTLAFVRLHPKKLPKNLLEKLSLPPQIKIIPTQMTYENDSNYEIWNLNFADSELFKYYGGREFAQDEMQVASHPVLANLREYLVGNTIDAFTIDENGDGTPIAIKGAKREWEIIVTPTIYGRNFYKASLDMVKNATLKVDKESYSNILALCSLEGYEGYYEEVHIGWLLANAFSGFLGAVTLCQRKIVIHTGFWGCGAFGGDKVLMCIIQILASYGANIDKILFFTLNEENMIFVQKAQMIALELLNEHDGDTIAIIKSLASMNFLFGKSDGN